MAGEGPKERAGPAPQPSCRPGDGGWGSPKHEAQPSYAGWRMHKRLMRAGVLCAFGQDVLIDIQQVCACVHALQACSFPS